MKRSLVAVIIVIAILSGIPEAFRQYRAVKDSGSEWLRTKMLEGFMNSAEVPARGNVQPRCEPDLMVSGCGTGQYDEVKALLTTIGKIKLGATIYVFE